MPCFKGLAVSIHTPDGPLPEYAIQKQSRQSRISTYIPVPPAKVPHGSATGKLEQSTFAISITLLTSGLNVPYSTPEPTPENPFPRPRVVGGLPGFTSERGQYGTSVPPYIPRSSNPNETIAAYIYFDGRVKEEVATLLRRGEETWVNSRWVSIPESEGGGLAEREFLFREVGLERWLNGLDLEGSKNRQEVIERRQARLEKKRRKKLDQMMQESEGALHNNGTEKQDAPGVLRYGGRNGSPVEDMVDDTLFSGDSDSEDEPPQPEAAGQIKVALFRVLASGEIKRGEYSPQFDAHDDDDAANQANGEGGDPDADHTTGFAKPKSLDPKSISTQTVTGLDPPESPYAVFTFFYRGQKQLRKMGIILNVEVEQTPAPAKRKSSGPDFSKLGTLNTNTFGTKGFSGYRDAAKAQSKTKSKDADAMDSDADDDDDEKALNGHEEAEVKQQNGNLLTPEDAARQKELAEGVQKIKLKRQHSAEPIADGTATRKSPYLKTAESDTGTPQSMNSTSADAGTPPEAVSPKQSASQSEAVGSPFKRQRASLPNIDNSIFGTLDANVKATASNANLDDVQKRAQSTPQAQRPADTSASQDSDEEL
ncbi:hypothetical protein K431DRAFT_216792 [Polychaeton citri CBS 116435]|uniref:DUF7918 domain-containing protein n=1 Tax=Polychaeton citri CBS 116435 TaxID=1314669 RepID=A0A9P4UR06_9PEZI|nr:hypothetical protein K431DRAFT_216792 [Polychaeton citri CBS 116435]